MGSMTTFRRSSEDSTSSTFRASHSVLCPDRAHGLSQLVWPATAMLRRIIWVMASGPRSIGYINTRIKLTGEPTSITAPGAA